MAQIAVTRVTHSCHLIEIGGRTFLTDPWFSTKPGYYQGEPIAIGMVHPSTRRDVRSESSVRRCPCPVSVIVA